jgi:hypothetical protein
VQQFGREHLVAGRHVNREQHARVARFVMHDLAMPMRVGRRAATQLRADPRADSRADGGREHDDRQRCAKPAEHDHAEHRARARDRAGRDIASDGRRRRQRQRWRRGDAVGGRRVARMLSARIHEEQIDVLFDETVREQPVGGGFGGGEGGEASRDDQ